MMGRVFTAENETPGQDAVVVLSHGLWQRRFGGAHDVLGRTMSLNGRPHEVIGVMPPALAVARQGGAVDVRSRRPSSCAPSRGSFWLPVIGRLKPGVSVEQAQTEMHGIARRLEQEYPANRGYGVERRRRCSSSSSAASSARS